MSSRSNQGRLISGMFYEKSSSDENKLGDITRNVKQILEDDYSSGETQLRIILRGAIFSGESYLIRFEHV